MGAANPGRAGRLPAPGAASPVPAGPRASPAFRTALAPASAPLFEMRWKIGTLLGLGRARLRPGRRVPSLRDRLPADLRDGPPAGLRAPPMTSVYLTENEWAAETANRTVHWSCTSAGSRAGRGGYRGQMAVLVKPNGRFGSAYMAAIKPFRLLLVYPALMRDSSATGRRTRHSGRASA